MLSRWNRKKLGSFPIVPDRDEILVDGTVFYAESNGMFFFREITNKKVTALQSYFFYLYTKESKLCFFFLVLSLKNFSFHH